MGEEGGFCGSVGEMTCSRDALRIREWAFCRAFWGPAITNVVSPKEASYSLPRRPHSALSGGPLECSQEGVWQLEI